MCRNIKTAVQFRAAGDRRTRVRDAALQFVRKVSGSTKPFACATRQAFGAGRRQRSRQRLRELLDSMETTQHAEEPRGRGGQGARQDGDPVCVSRLMSFFPGNDPDSRRRLRLRCHRADGDPQRQGHRRLPGAPRAADRQAPAGRPVHLLRPHGPGDPARRPGARRAAASAYRACRPSPICSTARSGTAIRSAPRW